MKKTRKSQTRTNRKSKHILKVIPVYRLLIIGLCILAAYVLLLDYRIHKEFEGSKWTLPARVYSRPIDIYRGQRHSSESLGQVLRTNNYQLIRGLPGPGQYSINGNTLNVHLRAFDYWDGHDPAILYQIESEKGAITRIFALKTRTETALIRIEPKLIGKIFPDHNEDRVLVGLDEVPQFLIDALISVEDRGFFKHIGIDFKAITRAFWVNIQSGELSQGGSTLTQQLVKNFFLTQKRTFSRKINEIIMALLLEWRYEKPEILSAYINEVYLGQNGVQSIHGFGNAAEFYFNRPLAELRHDQLALLAGMVRGASYYNPRRSPERAQSRRNLVLKLMAEQGYLDQQTLKSLQDNGLDVTDAGGGSVSSYHVFLDLARRQLLSDYNIDDLKNEGLKIYTSLDIMQQQALNQIVASRLSGLEGQRNLEAGSLDSATVIINPANAEVLAINGGRDIAVSGFNRALDARRPIGSLIKPFIYLTALSDSDQYTLLSGLQDKKFSLAEEDGSLWSPDNYDTTEHGNVSLIEAIVNSYNLATVRLGLDVGLQKVISTLHKAGLTGTIHAYPSLMLGTLELSPFEVAQLYQVLANGGYKVPLNSILEVLDDRGEPLQRRNLNIENSLNEQAVYLVNFLLSKVVAMGTASQLSVYLGDDIRLAGKTGTTNEYRDSWFAGFSDDILAVTWVGRDDNKPTTLTGASGAMLIWADIMHASTYTPLDLVEPENIAWTGDISVKFGNQCTELGPIPYIGNSPPENHLACTALGAEIKSRFNIPGWFQ